MTSDIRYPIKRLISWYHGNFCTRKCFNKEERIQDCYAKFTLFEENNKGLLMTHKEFKDMIDNDELKICKLGLQFRKKVVYWKQFERWKNDPSFNPDKFD